MAQADLDLSQQVADLSTQLLALTAGRDQLNAVSIKLPEFWTRSPEVWFAKVEAQFNTKGITQDQTRYDYIVSTLDINTAEEIQSLLVSPPPTDKYNHLKRTLIKTFGKSQSQKDTELLNLNGLGDKRPTALLRKINALNDDPKTLKRALFLMNLPTDIRSILAGQDIHDTDDLAEAADRIWETRMASVQQISTHSSQPEAAASAPEDTVAAIRTTKHNNLRTHNTPSTVCFYHQRFGPDARRCQPGCKFSSLVLKPSKQNRPLPGNGMAGR